MLKIFRRNHNIFNGPHAVFNALCLTRGATQCSTTWPPPAKQLCVNFTQQQSTTTTIMVHTQYRDKSGTSDVKSSEFIVDDSDDFSVDNVRNSREIEFVKHVIKPVLVKCLESNENCISEDCFKDFLVLTSSADTFNVDSANLFIQLLRRMSRNQLHSLGADVTKSSTDKFLQCLRIVKVESASTILGFVQGAQKLLFAAQEEQKYQIGLPLFDMIGTQHQLLSFPDWLAVMHSLLEWDPQFCWANNRMLIAKFYRLCDLFYAQCYYHCKSLEDVILFAASAGMLKRQFSERLYLKLIAVVQQNINVLKSNINFMAVLNWAFFRCQQRCWSRMILSESLDLVVSNLQTTNSDSISIPVHICIKELAYSMDKIMFKTYPHMLRKFTASLSEILPLTNRMDISTSVRLIHGMVRSRHVDTQLVNSFAFFVSKMNFEKLRLKELAMTTQLLSDYGYNDATFFKRISMEMLKPERLSECRQFPISMISAMTGLSYVGLLQHELFEIALSPEVYCHLRPSNGRICAMLLQLDGTIAIEDASYNGPRLDAEFKEWTRRTQTPGLGRSRRDDGSPSQYSEMLHRVADIVADSPVGQMYNQQIKPILDHMLVQDILLESKRDGLKIALMPMPESFYMRLYMSDGKERVVMRLSGNHRLRMRHLKQLGYLTIPISYTEYSKSDNKQLLVENKLKEIRV